MNRSKSHKVLVKKPSKKMNKSQRMAALRDEQAKSYYQNNDPARLDHMWKSHMYKEEEGKLNSIIKGKF